MDGKWMASAPPSLSPEISLGEWILNASDVILKNSNEFQVLVLKQLLGFSLSTIHLESSLIDIWLRICHARLCLCDIGKSAAPQSHALSNFPGRVCTLPTVRAAYRCILRLHVCKSVVRPNSGTNCMYTDQTRQKDAQSNKWSPVCEGLHCGQGPHTLVHLLWAFQTAVSFKEVAVLNLEITSGVPRKMPSLPWAEQKDV